MGNASVFKKQDLVKVSKLADRWQCSRQHIYNLIDQGKLQAFRFGGRRCMCVPALSVEEYEKSSLIDPDQ